MAFEITQCEDGVLLRGPENFDIYSTFECGQCFRWTAVSNNEYTGIVGNKVISICCENDSFLLKGCSEKDFYDTWMDYLDLKTDYGKIIDELSKDDPVMKRAADFAPGIHILRQPLFETLISFIISANNSIPNIKRVITRLSEAYGSDIEFCGEKYYTFPDPVSLADAEERDIRAMKAGFRSPYIINTAAMFLSDPVKAGDLTAMGYDDARKFLMRYPGVGGKVADCTLLFSGAFTKAFPVDTWVKKVMEEFYLEGDTPIKTISAFAIEKFGELGGYAQQYLFYYARSNM